MLQQDFGFLSHDNFEPLMTCLNEDWDNFTAMEEGIDVSFFVLEIYCLFFSGFMPINSNAFWHS
jgi:hypothetical protein